MSGFEILLHNKKKRLLLCTAAAFICLLVLLLPSAMTASSAATLPGGTDPQTAGYYLYAEGSQDFWLLSAQGSFIAPEITCSPGENSGATYEIGTDALSGAGGGVYPNVRNGAGVAFGCHSTVQFELATYVPSLWEGGSPVSVSDTVTPGDKMSVSVSYAHSITSLTCKINYCFVITLHDVTRGWTATAAVYDPTARRGEADFYLVRASPTTSLPHFGKLSTSGDYVTVGLSSSSTTGKRATLVYWSASTSLNSPNASVSYYVMVNTLGNSLATPSGLTKTGFSITFNLAS